MTFLNEDHPKTTSKIYALSYYLLLGKVVLVIRDYSNYNKGDDTQKITISKTKAGS